MCFCDGLGCIGERCRSSELVKLWVCNKSNYITSLSTYKQILFVWYIYLLEQIGTCCGWDNQTGVQFQRVKMNGLGYIYLFPVCFFLEVECFWKLLSYVLFSRHLRYFKHTITAGCFRTNISLSVRDYDCSDRPFRTRKFIIYFFIWGRLKVKFIPKIVEFK